MPGMIVLDAMQYIESDTPAAGPDGQIVSRGGFVVHLVIADRDGKEFAKVAEFIPSPIGNLDDAVRAAKERVALKIAAIAEGKIDID